MRISAVVFLVLLTTPLLAQTPAPTVHAGVAGKRVFLQRELGKWWQNADIVKKLQLSDAQVAQLDQVFYEHRMKLIDYGADMEKSDLKLQALLDADVPDEGQINNQVDQVLDARGKLERESTMMNLDLRKVLSLPQWRQLKSIRGEAGGFGDRIFFRKMIPPGGPETAPLPPGGGTVQVLPPLPGPAGDDTF